MLHHLLQTTGQLWLQFNRGKVPVNFQIFVSQIF